MTRVYIEDAEEWQSLNSLADIDVGLSLVIQNQGSRWFILLDSDTQPDVDSSNGKRITSLMESTPEVTTDYGDKEWWVRPITYGKPIIIEVVEG